MKKFLFALALLVAPALYAVTAYHVSCPSTGTADCLSAGNACDFSTLWANYTPVGDDTITVYGTSITGTGRYTGASCMFLPPAGIDGTAGHPINVITNDSVTSVHVVIDGQFTQTRVIDFSAHHDWTMNGVSGCCLGPSSNGVVKIGNSAKNITVSNVGCWDARVDYNSQCFQFANSSSAYPQPDLGPIVIDTFFIFGKGRKGASRYAANGTYSTTMRRGIVIMPVSTNVGPKMGESLNYHSKNSVATNTTFFWTGDGMPAGYVIQNGGGPYGAYNLGSGYNTSTTSLSVGTGAKTFTWTSGTSCPMSVGANPEARFLRNTSGNSGTYMQGPVTACNTGTKQLTINVTSTGGAGGPFTDWALDKVYTDNSYEQPLSMQGMDANTSVYDGNSDATDRIYGAITITRNADLNPPTYGVFYTLITDAVIQDSVSGIGTSYSTKKGFSLNNCIVGSSWPAGCQSPRNLFATRLTTVSSGCTATFTSCNTIGTDWTQSNLVSMATNAGFTYDGSGTSKSRVCFLLDDTGAVTGTARWPHPLSAGMQTAMTAYGYTAIDEKAEVAAMFGAIPASCDASVNTPTSTPTGVLTNTPTPTQTATPTPSLTPSQTPTPTPTFSSVCNSVHTHSDPYYGPYKHSHGGPCIVGTTQVKQHIHHIPTPSP